MRIDYVAWQCFDTALGLAWLGIIFVYLAILQLVGIVLAFQTRKVKIKMLNDAKYIAAIIYISSLVLVVLIVGTVSPIGSYINVFEVVLSGGILAATTVFEALIFIPKVRYIRYCILLQNYSNTFAVVYNTAQMCNSQLDEIEPRVSDLIVSMKQSILCLFTFDYFKAALRSTPCSCMECTYFVCNNIPHRHVMINFLTFHSSIIMGS